jgi:hypothetical protein
MFVHNTSRLVIKFLDAPPPAPPPAAVAAAPAAREAAKPPAAPGPPGAAPAAAKADAAPARPIDLSARAVEATVTRSEDKNNLEKLWTEGDVVVRQAPAKAGEQGVDVHGQTLLMEYHPEGNYFEVRGFGANDTEDSLAELRLDKLYLVSQEVIIDQAKNMARSHEPGAMQTESTTNFQGAALAKPVPLEIHWDKEMFFNGRYAEFLGGVQATQENSHLAAQSLRVFFDRAVSLKEGGRGEHKDGQDDSPHVRNLVCYKDVRVEDLAREDDRVVRYQRIRTHELEMNTIEPDDPPARKEKTGEGDQEKTSEGNEVRAGGGGDLLIYQRGGADPAAVPAPPPAAPPAKPPAKPAEDKPDGEMKTTFISFEGGMYANSKTNTAVFYKNVRLLNTPADNPYAEIDLDAALDDLPKGAMYLRCDRLDVFDRGDRNAAPRDGQKKSKQEMTAKGGVQVRAREFYGRSEKLTYNEEKDQLILEGGDGGLATLYKVARPGAKPQEIKGKKITYIRSTGIFKIEEGEWINVAN